jgi:hypothetical protein
MECEQVIWSKTFCVALTLCCMAQEGEIIGGETGPAKRSYLRYRHMTRLPLPLSYCSLQYSYKRDGISGEASHRGYRGYRGTGYLGTSKYSPKVLASMGYIQLLAPQQHGTIRENCRGGWEVLFYHLFCAASSTCWLGAG